MSDTKETAPPKMKLKDRLKQHLSGLGSSISTALGSAFANRQ